MSMEDLNRIVADHLAELVARLDADGRAEVASIQARMRAASDPKPYARRLLLALAEALPPDHPVAQAILRQANWRAPDVLDRAAIDAEAAAILSLAGLSFEPEDVPTTDVPTTDVPTTDVPTTDVPMTDVPMTDVPMTDVPMTDVPMTDVPMTDVPTTDVPTTDVPTTDVPMTDAPTTEAAGVATAAPGPAALMDLVRRRVLAATPVLSDDEARALGRHGAAPDLIRLDAPGGATAFPRFQFEPSGRPREVVVRVNQLLGADRDPWGVTAWWLATNVWLGDPPADLLGADRDDDLVACAGATLGED
ncbi:hypothetical protein ACFWAA_18365 [Streptomyces sp. NPDC059922]|uniref:hypothetical protein n=1 Tax=Streptomyces sp. NPDC059922 TaxID=3347005 RepID=UPI0036482D67